MAGFLHHCGRGAWLEMVMEMEMGYTQGTNISHRGKRKIIFKSALGGDMLVPRKVDAMKIEILRERLVFFPYGC